ncbi:hypothetical protein jhhlp_001358 [Lomentospora prolificans]|uniref:Cutinase n=1 Tax=Lomentospora prolificans TaxID=41688 RepID=A0A2N3NI83_9PEZI|nr:hypothetical protein jhhlp_001358 [Lomentospora prolificans]
MLAALLFLVTAHVAALPNGSSVLSPRQVLPTTCKDVHLFLARGAGDPYPGTQGPLVDVVCEGLVSCDHEDVLYVGTFDRVCDSVTTGVVNATRQITEYAQKCPDSKLVLCGHSEGAAVILNTIGGGGSTCPGGTMPESSPIDPTTAPGSHVVAVAITGDMRHTAGQTYNVGTGAAKSGIWPRSQAELSGLTAWEHHMRSWCDDADPVCAGGNSVAAHGAYMDRKKEIAAWIREMLGV